jgi:ferric-dicitrate binding protein FerR (iron transport regulator)
MSNGRACAFLPLLATVALVYPVGAQSVISTHSGLIHFFEGTVYLSDQPLESHLGKFPSVPKGGELRTADGRAEVLLTPGVFLRLGQKSAIRMISNDLADTQIELRAGSAIVDSAEPNPDTSVTLIYKDWKIHFLQKGVYRIDSDPALLCVRQGQAEVLAGESRDGDSKEPITVERGMSLPFASVLVPEKATPEAGDTLSDWENGRSE